MFTLVANVIDDPRQISCTETYNAVTGLPFEHLVTAELLIHVVGGAAFELADELAHQQRWRNSDGEVDVRFDAADFVNERAGRFDDAFAEEAVGERLDLWSEERRTEFAMSDDVEVDFAVVVARQDAVLRV
jgi:hypothetical protein